MVVFISSNITTSRKIAKRLNGYGKTCTAVEVEYGNNSLTSKDIGVDSYYNHHHTGPDAKQPCLAYTDFNQSFKENFIISHIDADTIFGIGWLSGIFPKDKILIDIAKIISIMDNEGSHKIPKELISKYYKEWEVVKSFISHAKKSVSKVKYKDYYNCSSIIYSTLMNIVRIVHDPKSVELRYSKLINADINSKAKLHPMSNEELHIFDKKCNDFDKGTHNFIIIKSKTISIFGRDKDQVKKYFPEGLNNFLAKYFDGAGGHFASAGTSRLELVDNIKYLKFLNAFNARINEIKFSSVKV